MGYLFRFFDTAVVMPIISLVCFVSYENTWGISTRTIGGMRCSGTPYTTGLP